MPGKKGSKLKLLHLMDILWLYTDEENVLTATELCDKLEEYGSEAERKSIYSDIDTLRQFGFDIVNTNSPKRGFFLAARSFEIAELRLLADAVQAAYFISNKKTKTLISKLYRLCSESQAENIEKQIFVENKLKCSNEEIYYTIDILNNAIQQGKQVEFKYFKRTLTSKMTTRSEEKRFVVNPYALIWLNDHYYLVCNNPKYDNIMHTRLDRMEKVVMLEEKARGFSEVSEYKESFDAADYSRKLFNMFSGETKQVELRCSNSIIDDILDRFGKNVPLKADGEEFFIIRIKVAVSDGLVSWIMQYGTNIKVKTPISLAKTIKEKANSISELYKGL
ncbi:MAG: WYL domain-containing transcriptional regulator [Eubacteriales bacterium]